jgi:glutamate-5-semialdehyde dehydrogenase
MNTHELAKQAKIASSQLLELTEEQRNLCLKTIASALITNAEAILKANREDLKEAKNLSSSMIDRLTLTIDSIQSMAKSCHEIGAQAQVVGIIEESHGRPNGLTIKRQRIPLGVIGMIFESRPNVVIDGIALAIKSGNAIILKGGKEAQHSNLILYTTVVEALKKIYPTESLKLVQTREEINDLLKLDQYIDLMVPRGGSSLIRYVKENAKMPVVAHDKGLCHLYIHSDALQALSLDQIKKIILNAKIQRPGVCNALETLLIHHDFVHKKEIIDQLLQENVEIFGCHEATKISDKVKNATDENFHTEYLSKSLSLKIVSSFDSAIKHIQDHTSHHTEAILANDPKIIERFLNLLDSSCLVINASTRFNDGGELGLGAELGISTSKLHAYGPMGAKEMTTTRFIVEGKGQIR